MDNSHPERDFGAFIREQGLVLEGEPQMDGRVHRIPAQDGKPNNQDGAYKGYLDGRPSGWARNFRSGGEIVKWRAEREQALTASQQAQRAAELKAQMAQKAEQVQQQTLEAAMQSEQRWNTLSLQPESDRPTYLERKQVAAFDVRFEGHDVVVPLRDVDGKLWSLQTISPEKDAPKLYERGARKTGNMHTIGTLEDGQPILVAEGYATGASLAMASKQPVVVAFDAGNLDAVVGQLSARYPQSPLLIMADDDRYREDGRNVGLDKAHSAGDKHNALVVTPRFKSRDSKPTDFNDLHVSEGLEAVARQVERALDMAREMKVSPTPDLPAKLPREATTMTNESKTAAQADLFNSIEPAKRSHEKSLASVKDTTAYIDTTFQTVAVEQGNQVYLMGGTTAIDKFAKQTQLSDDDHKALRELHQEAAATPVNTYDTEVLHRVAELRRSRKEVERAPHPALSGERLAPDEVRTKQLLTPPPQDALPLDLQRQYLKVQNKFYHADRPDSLAFIDKGYRLETQSDSDRTAAAFVAIAEGRGWDTIKVSGSQSFRREVWLEAASRGMLVNGFKATEVDRALLEHRMATGRSNAVEQDGTPRAQGLRPQSEPTSPKSDISQGREGQQHQAADVSQPLSAEAKGRRTTSRKASQPLTGTLVEHGPAKYQFDPNESSNYFVKLHADGKERIVWGVQLGEALQQAGAKEGDQITLERAGAKSVVVEKNVRDERGQVVGRETAGAKRNEWRVEVSEAFKNLPLRESASRHPELLTAASVMAAATVVARNKFADDKTREQFLEKTRSRIASDVASGREMREVRLHRTATRERQSKKRTQPELQSHHNLDRSR